ncbi:hypothetical protein [Nannocystis radixulma]|uniref:Uncharacterized protein n=1 Tax=Nannocystis radixulma TaxID=2995305 RepID=A0ABT5B1D2_9BACT|nr:hypothetical protein [Nannocystis radixulma]MDC0667887.1 hypothetical protein [Nannocystis radixulma]
MNVATVLVLAALSASILLFLRTRPRLLPILALVGSGVQALMLFKVVSLGGTGLPLALLLGGLLAASGVLLYLRVSSKPLIAAATVVAMVGAIQVLSAVL